MSWGEGDALSAQFRYPRSRSWLQFYVDLFASASPQRCKGLSLVVVPDPTRRNGCNWSLSVNAPETLPGQGALCLRHIEDELRLLFSIFDMVGGEERRIGLGLHRS